MQFSALILDMDGVFVDTEPLVFDVFRRVFSPLGIALTDEYMYKFIGKPFSNNLQDIRDDFHIDFDEEAVRRAFDLAYVEKLSQQSLPPQEGILPLIERARKRRMKTALCTTTSRPQVRVVFEQVKKSGSDPDLLFDAVVTGDDVSHKKPHPQPYLTAAAMLAVSPRQCLAVEDTVTGVLSAKAAGCFAAALLKPYNLHLDFSPADRLLEHLGKAAELLDD